MSSSTKITWTRGIDKTVGAIDATLRWAGNRVGDISNRTYDLAAWLDRVAGWVYHQGV